MLSLTVGAVVAVVGGVVVVIFAGIWSGREFIFMADRVGFWMAGRKR